MELNVLKCKTTQRVALMKDVTSSINGCSSSRSNTMSEKTESK